MRVGIHINQTEPQAQALAAGFAELGYKVIWRNGTHYTRGQTEPFDAVVTDGIRGNRRALIDDYAAKGIPAMVVEYGYVERANEDGDGYWSLGLDAGWVPGMDCPSDRWKRLGRHIAKPHSGAVTVIAGQKIGDPSHPFTDEAKMCAWALKMAERVADTDVVFRPHPRSPHVAPAGMKIDTLSLAESLARAGLIITYTSNIGNDALLAGVNVEADGPATYAGVDMDGRERYFNRLAYAQWTLDEIASGEAIRFVLNAKSGERWQFACDLFESVKQMGATVLVGEDGPELIVPRFRNADGTLRMTGESKKRVLEPNPVGQSAHEASVAETATNVAELATSEQPRRERKPKVKA